MTRNWIKQALADGNPAARGQRSDYDLNEALRGQVKKPHQDRAAAVLVPLIERDDEITVLLTRRSVHLPTHAGQISFPGGKIDPGDDSPEAAALRETEEEVGLQASDIELIGRLDTYETSTGFIVTPVVGLVTPDHTIIPEPGEVDEVFEVPLSFFLQSSNIERHSREFMGAERHYYAMPFGDYYIWGATAAMLVNLRDVMASTQKDHRPKKVTDSKFDIGEMNPL